MKGFLATGRVQPFLLAGMGGLFVTGGNAIQGINDSGSGYETTVVSASAAADSNP